MGMTAEELEQAVRGCDEDTVIALVAGATEAERRAQSKFVLTLKQTIAVQRFQGVLRNYAEIDRIRFERQDDAAMLAVLGTCTLTEIKRLRDINNNDASTPERASNLFAARHPAWLQNWVDWKIGSGCPWEYGSGTSPWLVIRKLIQTGMIAKPDSDAYVYSMIQCYQGRAHKTGPLYFSRAGPDEWLTAYRTTLRDILLSDPDLLDDEVWRLFVVEGADGISLANDYETWQPVLLDLSAEGRLCRGRLLAASLDALQRDFAPFRSGWFSRFHEALKPSPDERTALVDTYLSLVSSKTAANVSFALRVLSEIEKAGKLPLKSAIDSLAPALATRQKGTAATALRLLERAVKREPALAVRAAFVAADALIHPAVEVQSKALDVIEKAGDRSDSDLRDALAARLGEVVPSLRGRLAALLPQNEATSIHQRPASLLADTESLELRAAALAPQWASLAGIDEALADLRAEKLTAPALDLNPLQIPRLDPVRRIEPVQNVDTLIDLFASLIENSVPPDAIQRVM